MTALVIVLSAVVLATSLFDLPVRRRLRRTDAEPQNDRLLRASLWSMRVRALAALGLLISAPAALAGQTAGARWAILGATCAVLLPLVGVIFWFNVEISRLLRRRVQ